MSAHAVSLPALEAHLAELRGCVVCPAMHRPAVVGRPAASRILLVGQAPGLKEPVLSRPFAWTAGKTLFKWLESATGWPEDEARDRIYFAAVCRCFPGKALRAGGDRVPDPAEIANCSRWLRREFEILQPALVLAVGKLAITQFHSFALLSDIIGRTLPITYSGHACDLLPLPHPSGASTWHRMEPGKSLLAAALRQLAAHPAITAA